MKHPSPLALFISAGLLFGCAGVKPASTATGKGGGSGASTGLGTGSGGATGAGGGGGSSSSSCNGPCDDFGGGPFGPDGTSGSVPSGAAQIFGGSGSASGGPCLYEPQDGTLFPSNWLRPRFSWTGTGDLYELRVSAANQQDDLVVYTDQTTWTMPAAMWRGLGVDSADMPMTVTIRSSSHGGAPSMGTQTSFTIAPVGASGNLVYWSPTGSISGGMTVSGQTTLNGFAVGDETVKQVLTCGSTSCDISPPASSWQTFNQGLTLRAVSCIGCHTSTPDGNYIAFNDFYPWGGVLASGQAATLGMPPAADIGLGAGGYKALIQPWLGIMTFSENHWTTGDHVVVAPLGTTSTDADQQPGLAWIDLESAAALPSGQNPFTTLKGTAWNWIYQPVSGKYAAAPSWSRAPGDDFVVFTMTSNVKSGRMGTGTAHLYQVPYSKSAPQTPTPIPGDGSDSSFAQYYGTLSADDNFVVFDRISASAAASEHPDMNSTDSNCNPSPCTWSGMYMQPQAELYVLRTAGGTATRLAANDPPSCAPGLTQPQTMNNTWAKWSPQIGTANGKTYYWLIFSSWRQGAKEANGDPIAQLFMTVIVQPETGPIQTYPAVYLWNQPPNVSNFTPAWDVFKIGSVG